MLCGAIHPMIAPEPKGGRPHVPDRACLTEVVLVLTTELPWESPAHELGRGSGETCWRRSRDLQRAGM